MFKTVNGGGRTGVRKLVIVLTDGKGSGTPTSQAAAAELKATHSATIVAIGVGSSINLDELKQIASQESFVFTTDDFAKLSTILDVVVASACQGK